MKRELLAMALLAGLLAASIASAQITSYVDEQSRRVYVNADPPPKKVVPPKKNSRHSVLVRRDARTGELVEIPAREPAEPPATNAPAPQPAARPEQAAATESAAANSETQAQPGAENRASGSYVASELSVATNVDGIIADTAERHAVDPALVRAVIKAESNFNPTAVSYKGAVGLMQLMPGTARRLGVRNSFDPEQNLDGGVRHLKYLLELYGGNLRLSLAAYNAGEKAVERHNGIPPYRETQQYVRKIASWYRGDPLAQGARQQADRWGIVKYVDSRGKVRFSNTEVW